LINPDFASLPLYAYTQLDLYLSFGSLSSPPVGVVPGGSAAGGGSTGGDGDVIPNHPLKSVHQSISIQSNKGPVNQFSLAPTKRPDDMLELMHDEKIIMLTIMSIMLESLFDMWYAKILFSLDTV
jgi:hypothetical protein